MQQLRAVKASHNSRAATIKELIKLSSASISTRRKSLAASKVTGSTLGGVSITKAAMSVSCNCQRRVKTHHCHEQTTPPPNYPVGEVLKRNDKNMNPPHPTKGQHDTSQLHP